ncbi:hypothetical protein GCM10010405_00100 [Streptomyces macrosporus]|uniref:Uncharacterized protein n=1 Tax=Streptomyces macrosporus TaxID=44032 RepID=A0ABP5WAG9_9ACTN
MARLLAALLAWFLPARGKRRAAPTPAPVHRFTPCVPAYRVAAANPPHLPGEEIALVRPYLIAWERASTAEREAILRRNRRMDAAEVAA